MKFDWNEDQQALRRAASEFGKRVLTEGIEERDRQGAFDEALWAECAGPRARRPWPTDQPMLPASRAWGAL